MKQLWLGLFALLLLSCSESAPQRDAQIVVVVETDFAYPTALSEVEFYVKRVGASETLSQSFSVPVGGELGVKPPLVLPIAPEKDLEASVEVRVEGFRRESGAARTLVVRRVARVRFQPGKVVLLRMDLVQSCQDQYLTCERMDLTCGERGCIGIDDPDVHPWTGNPSTGSPFEPPDAGMADGGPQDGSDDGDAGAPDGDGGSVPERDRPVELALGDNHSCVRTARGRVFCWGKGDYGELGDGTLTRAERCTLLNDSTTHGCTPSPVEVMDLPAASQLEAGASITCAVHEPRPNFAGNVSCWGEAFDANNAAPVSVVLDGIRIDDALDVQVGGKTGCIRREGGLPACFGEYVRGELGNGTVAYPGRIAVASALEGVTTPAELRALGVGDRHVCGVIQGGQVACWGDNSYTQTGMPRSDQAQLTPVVLPQVVDAQALFVGGTSNCVLLDGQAHCWGEDTWGQLGNAGAGSQECQQWATCRAEPSAVRVDQIEGGAIAQLALGYSFACARFADGRLGCWGSNEQGQLGPRFVEGASGIPVDMPAPLDHVVEVAAGAYHACAILADDRVMCWGNNDGAQLGTSAAGTPKSTTPLEIQLPL